MMHGNLISVAMGIIAGLGGAGAVAHAQPTSQPQRPAPLENQRPARASRGLEFTLSGDYAYQFETDLDGEGEFDVNRFGFGAGVRFEPADDFTLRLRMAYRVSDYEFSGGDPGSFAARELWDDIHSLAFGAVASWQTTNEWSIFGGPVFEFSRESGADWGESFVGGGVIGVTYKFGDHLTLGGGVGIVTQIEDNARIYPIIIVDWRITDSLRVSTQSSTSASATPGIELIWDAGGGWEIALGGASRFERFRLDDDGPAPPDGAPDGVGEETGIPIWLRASYRMSDNLSFDLVGGATFEGEFDLEDESGARIADEGYDPAPFVGVGLNVKF